MILTKRSIIVPIIAVLLLLLIGHVLAATAPTLGMVDSFAVLSDQSISNTGATVITGDVGISPGTASSVTGFYPPGSYSGVLHAANAVSLQAQTDATTVYNALDIQPCDVNLTGQDLGLYNNIANPALVPNVYCFDSSAQLTGSLVLDAAGDPNAVWIFRMGSTLTTAPGSTVTFINSADPLCNIFWQVGSSATIDTTTEFMGQIFAVTSVTMNTDANLIGRAVALGGSITLQDNNISFPTCIGESVPLPGEPTATTESPSPTAAPDVPELPDTGSGSFILNEMSPWSLLLFSGLFTSALVFGMRSLRKNDHLKE